MPAPLDPLAAPPALRGRKANADPLAPLVQILPLPAPLALLVLPAHAVFLAPRGQPALPARKVSPAHKGYRGQQVMTAPIRWCLAPPGRKANADPLAPRVLPAPYPARKARKAIKATPANAAPPD